MNTTSLSSSSPTSPLFVLIADGSFDQICETRAGASREKRDLERMGCEVRVRKVSSWEEANALEEKLSAV